MCNQTKGFPLRMRAAIKPRTQTRGMYLRLCPLEQDDKNQIFSSQLKVHCCTFSNVTSFNFCLISISPKIEAKDDGAGIPRNQPRAAVVEKGCDTALPVTTNVITLNPFHSSRAGPSGLKHGVTLLAHDSKHPPLPALPL